MHTILVADNDKVSLNAIVEVLDREGYDVVPAYTSNEVFESIKDTTPDLFLIDMSLPDGGVSLCRELRTLPETSSQPIIMLTNHHSPQQVSNAFDAGGDDYIRKPFVPRELFARIRAHLRRANHNGAHIPSLRILPASYQVFVDTREVALTRVEFELLLFMSRKPEEWFGTQELLEYVWQYPDGVGDTALVRNHIRNLRRKLEIDPQHPSVIQSRHGKGYSIQANVEIVQHFKYN